METPKDLKLLIQDCWQLLEVGALQKKDPFHTPVIGTIDPSGMQMRTVVLRKTDVEKRNLYFYTDYRSTKIQQLKKNPTLNWLFYHPRKNCQIRVNGRATIHYQNELTLEKWQSLPYYSRKTYGTMLPPSTPLSIVDDNLPDLWQKETVPLTETEYAYANFAVVVCEINHLEWLSLQRSGHQRAMFNFVNNAWQGGWIVP